MRKREYGVLAEHEDDRIEEDSDTVDDPIGGALKRDACVRGGQCGRIDEVAADCDECAASDARQHTCDGDCFVRRRSRIVWPRARATDSSCPAYVDMPRCVSVFGDQVEWLQTTTAAAPAAVSMSASASLGWGVDRRRAPRTTTVPATR